MPKIKIKPLSKDNFEKFGQVVEVPAEEPTIAADILSYWAKIAVFYVRGRTEVGICTVKNRPMVFNQMERHLRTPEMLVPIDGEFVIPVAPAEELDNMEAAPSVKRVAAFRVKKNQALIMKEGVWHWAPFPRAVQCSFLVIFKKDTAKEDLYVKEVVGAKEVSLV